MEEPRQGNQVKLIVPLEKTGEDYPPVDYEELWSTPTGDGQYRVENIPFFAVGIARGDLVSAAADQGSPRFLEVVQASGHSTIRLLVQREDAVPGVVEKFARLGCDSEITFGRLVALNVPPTVPLEALREKLALGLAQSTWEYEEACIFEPADASQVGKGA